MILLEHTPLLACFDFVERPKLLLFRRINFRKKYFYVDIGVQNPRAPVRQHRLKEFIGDRCTRPA